LVQENLPEGEKDPNALEIFQTKVVLEEQVLKNVPPDR
jgi:hypothetical protein